MKKLMIALAAGMGLALGSIAAHSKLPAPPPKSDAEKAADAAKAAAAKAKAAELDAKYEDKAVANYRKTKSMAAPDPASMSGKK